MFADPLFISYFTLRSTTEKNRGVILTEIQFFTESQRLSLIQILSEKIVYLKKKVEVC